MKTIGKDYKQRILPSWKQYLMIIVFQPRSSNVWEGKIFVFNTDAFVY